MTEYNEFPNLVQRLNTLTRRVREQETAPRLYAVGVGKGGLRVYDRGKVSIRDGGDINIMEGGDVTVGAGGSINILSGGQIVSQGSAQFSGAARMGGNTRINGNLNINGNVSFPDGKLDGAFLQGQFDSVDRTGSSNGFNANYSNTERTIISLSVTVPTWATSMFAMMSGSCFLNNINFSTTRSPVIKLFTDTRDSAGDFMPQYAWGSATRAAGSMNHIQEVNVANKTTTTVGLKVDFASGRSGATGDARFTSTLIFTR